jgi:hypothetical protein
MGRFPRNTRKRETHETRFLFRLFRAVFAFVVFVVFVGAASVARGADGSLDLTVTPIARDGQVVVSFDLSDGYTPDVRDAIHSGLLTTFSYERPTEDQNAVRAWMTHFDRVPLSATAALEANGEYWLLCQRR